MKESQVKEYAEWVLHECNNPVDEIEWLVSNLPESMQDDIKYNVLGFIKPKKND